MVDETHVMAMEMIESTKNLVGFRTSWRRSQGATLRLEQLP